MIKISQLLKLKYFLLLSLVINLLLAGCAASNASGPGAGSNISAKSGKPLVISAIPDQDPEKLQRLYGTVADYLSKRLGVPVVYKPVTDYTASVTAFKVGDLDLVWFGGLTGVQARLQVPGSHAILQRDIDSGFHSVFIANKASGLQPFSDVKGLSSLKGRTFTFGSDSSTSGRLMPQYYLKQAGVNLGDFKGEAGFSGSHDKTIQLVEAGSYDAGVLNEQVWESRTKQNEVDLNKVEVLWRSPAYFDYHWLIRPDVVERYGPDFVVRLQQAFMTLDPNVPQQKEILDLFGAKQFIETQDSNYAQIEEVARELGKVK